MVPTAFCATVPSSMAAAKVVMPTVITRSRPKRSAYTAAG